MQKLLFLLAASTALAAYSQHYSDTIRAAGGSRAQARRLDLCCAAIILILSIFAGLRTNYNDTAAYIRDFVAAPTLAEFRANPESRELFHNPGFYWMQSALRSVTSNPHVFLMLCAFFVEWSLVRFFKREADSFPFTMFLFMTLGTFVFTLAATKQAIAMGILTFGFSALREKKWLRYYFIVFVAMLFHTYALAFAVLPLFRAKPWSLFTYLFLIGLVLVMSNFQGTISAFLDFAGEQGKDISEEEVFDSNQVNMMRVAVYAVVPAMSFLFRRHLFRDSSEMENLMVHMSIISLAFMLLGTLAGANMFARMATYFELGTLCCLPWILKKSFDERSYRIMRAVTVACFLAYFVYAWAIHVDFSSEYTMISFGRFLRRLFLLE